ncbi:MAG: allantoinase AllB [Acidobacteriota bacterium]|nr:allantoinase AllB [Acidobacteriota bacterium]
MAGADWILRGRRVVLPGGMRPAAIRVRDGVIQEVRGYDCAYDEDAGDLVVMPGLVDSHVHINEPGRAEWEGFATATRAAARGGVTTLVDMPLNSIPATTSLEGYAAKVKAAAGKCWVDVGFWGGVVPGNSDQLEGLLAAGCLGFKCFLAPSGVEEFANVSEHDLREAMPVLARAGAALLAHAELPAFLMEPRGDPRCYTTYLESRPAAAENFAIELLIGLCRTTGCRIHVVHLASSEAVEMLRAARGEGLPITVETCPQYLYFAAEEIPDAATEFKCAPPIRNAANRDALWEALRAGVIDLIATDHSPCPPEMKRRDTGDFFAAWGGIASLQLGLPAVWTEARRRGFGIEHVSKWMSAAPARLAGLEGRKGAIEAGCDADVVLFDPDAESTVDPGELLHRHKLTPYAGRKLTGKVRKTWLRAHRVQVDGAPQGRLLTR